MAKIPFDSKFRPQIESGEYKVETRDGRRVRIICWDRVDKYYPIIALALYEGGENYIGCTNNGCFYQDGEQTEYDLFLITPEPELGEFEDNVRMCIVENLTNHIKDGNGNEISSTVFIEDKTAKNLAAELLTLARKELMGEMLTSDPKESAIYKAGVLDGKAEALKDLPRWKKLTTGAMCDLAIMSHSIVKGTYYLTEKDLEKIPGWKGDGGYEKL